MTSRTYEQFTALGLNAAHTGPFTFEHRAPRDTNPTGNYYASRGEFEDNVLGFVKHITAGLQDFEGPDNSAEATDAWGRNTSTASWPGISDADSIINSLHPKRVAFLHGVPGYNFNRALYGMEISKLTADWRNMPQAWVDATLRNAAAYAAPIVIRNKIPLVVNFDREDIHRKITAKQKVGFTEHWVLSPTNRNDAGRVGTVTTFPWDRYFTFLRRQMALISGTTVTPLPSTTPLTVRDGTILEVTATLLNARRGPSTNNTIDGVLKQGQRIKATGRTSNGWIEFYWTTTTKRWVNSAWLKVISQPAVPSSVYPVLQLGSTGALVKALQIFAMSSFPLYAGSIRDTGGADGSYGYGTEKWVIEFQRRTGLAPDGRVGPYTWKKLESFGFKP